LEGLSGFFAWACVALLLVASAFFSTVEAALFSLSSVRLERMKEQGVRSADVISKLLSAPRRLVVTLLLGNETANMAAAAIIAWIAFSSEWRADISGLDGPLAPAIALGFALILVAGQAVPKVVGAAYPEGLSRTFSVPFMYFMRAAAPARWAFRGLAEALLKLVGAYPDRIEHVLAEEDIRELVEEGSREGLLDVTERELLVNLLRSGEASVEDVMTPRTEIVSVPVDADPERVREVMEEHDFSRLPVYRERRENIVGLVTVKDLVKIKLTEQSGVELSLEQVMRPPIFVPESRRLRDVLMDFRKKRMHLAVVVDEFGSVSGLVTMEDVIEEIFGEVREEDEIELINLGENHWKVLGRMETDDFNARTGSGIPADGSRTLSGLVLSRLGRRPRPGDEVRLSGFRFKVLAARGITITQLEVVREQ